LVTADQFLADLASFVGYAEQPAGSNCNQFSHALGRPCEPWCADFLIARADHHGLILPSRSAYTPTLWHAFQNAGRAGQQPRKGAFVFFNFPHGDPIDHVGCLESWTSSGVTTIDGNTSVHGSQSNGGQVQRRQRLRTLVVGYGYPAYASSPPPSQGGIVVHEPFEVDMNITDVDVTIPTGATGDGWAHINYTVDKVLSVIGPGLRPDVDGKVLTAKVGAAADGAQTVISVQGWAPGQPAVVRVRVAT